MSYKKVEKEFCLTDDSVNVYGYRMLTSGLQLDRFAPAVGFLMHAREQGVAVRWEDFRIEGDKVFAKPVVNTKRYPNLAEEIENGFYNAASCGKIVALEMSDDESLKIEGQTGITVTKWFPREVSIVDIPGNYSALAQLYDEADHVIHDLTDQKKDNQKPKKMDEIKLNKEQLELLNLADHASEQTITAALRDLADKAKRTEKAEKELKDLQDKTSRQRVSDILEKGIKERKLTKDLADELEKTFAGNPDGLQALVDKMQPQQLVTDKLSDGKIPADLPEKYRGKSLSDLYVSGDLADLKTNYPDYYNQLKNK